MDLTAPKDDDFRRMLDLSTMLGVIVDETGRLSYLTPGWRFVLGYSPDRLAGSALLALIHPDDLARASEILRPLPSSGVEASDVELRLRARDGSYRWVQWTWRGEPATARVFGIGYDITCRRLLEEELQHARAAAAEPMNQILCSATRLLATPLAEHQREMLEGIRQSGETLRAIIDDALGTPADCGSQGTDAARADTAPSEQPN